MVNGLQLPIALMVSLVVAFAIAWVSPNLMVVGAITVIIQGLGMVWMVENGTVFSSYSALNLVVMACLTFIWFMISAQMFLGIQKRRAGHDAKGRK